MKNLCCPELQRATEHGTDNEMYGALVSYSNGDWRMGCELPPLVFCPWCGASLAPSKSVGEEAQRIAAHIFSGVRLKPETAQGVMDYAAGYIGAALATRDGLHGTEKRELKEALREAADTIGKLTGGGRTFVMADLNGFLRWAVQWERRARALLGKG